MATNFLDEFADEVKESNEPKEEKRDLSFLERLVPNKFPTIPPGLLRIGLIGEAPGADEVSAGEPFVGISGRFLDKILSNIGIVRSQCFVGNVMQIRPPLHGKKQLSPIDKWKKTTNGDLEHLRQPALDYGLKTLKADLQNFSPNLCVLLGKTALWAAKDETNLGDWRGSLFLSGGLIEGQEVKCLATYHPAAALRQYSFYPFLIWDLRRALKEGKTKELTLPKRNHSINLSYENLTQKLQSIITLKSPISVDIEGGVNSMSCVGFALSSYDTFILPFERLDRSSYWNLDQETALWKLLADIMADGTIPKTWQNGLYDRFVLQYGYDILVRNSADDTMLKWFEEFCELEKALSVQTSVLTDEPFYKFNRKTEDQDTFYRYCCTDAAVTFEINKKLTPKLDHSQTLHYKFNNDCLNFLLYAELRGMRYDATEAAKRLEEMQGYVYELQEKLDEEAKKIGALEGINFNGSNEEVLRQVREICCYKKDKTKPKKEFEEEGYHDIASLLQQNDLPLVAKDRARISSLCGTTMNTKSAKQFQKFLYQDVGLPTQYKLDKKTGEYKITTDYEALLKLSKTVDNPILLLALDLSRLRTRQQMLALRSVGGRMHCSYNLVGSETGRITSSKSMIYFNPKQRVGGNMQTVPDDWEIFDEEHPIRQGMRDLFIADEDCYIGKCDLKGADGWTIGAYLASLGDSTLLDDLKFGLKPAQVIAYGLIYGRSSIVNKSREELKEMVKLVTKEMWQYFVGKIGIWGYFYLMGPRKFSENVFIQSEGKVKFSEADAREFQDTVGCRYNAKKLHAHFTKLLTSQPYPAKLTAPNGQVRKFFGRNFKDKCEILGEALAHLPQVVTTYATLQAARKLWLDPENRIENPAGHGHLFRVEILHQVHDELVMQWRIEDTDFAKKKISQWFDNPIIIAGQKIIVPFDGAFGTNWAMDSKGKVGNL